MRDTLPDPVAYARQLSDEQLHAYKTEYGEESREWIIAQQELRRRQGMPIGRVAMTIAAILWLALAVYQLVLRD
jgi:hypothetical protein